MLAVCRVWLGTTVWHSSAHSANSAWSILARIWTRRCQWALELNTQRCSATVEPLCVFCLFVVALIWYTASVYHETHLFLQASTACSFFFPPARCHLSQAAERPCDDVTSSKIADRLVFVCTDVTHVCVLATFKLCLPSFGTSQGDTIGWISGIVFKWSNSEESVLRRTLSFCR